MIVSYAITVHNELKEITSLIDFLLPRIDTEDEIVVQYDKTSVTRDVIEYLDVIKELQSRVIVVGFPLNKDFAAFKNNLKENCKGEFIFQIDADEAPSEILLSYLKKILTENSVDIIFVPRINTVEGLTQSHVDKWGWPISKLETQIGEKMMDTASDEYKFLKKLGYLIEETEPTYGTGVTVKYYKPINAFPDYQTRIYRNTKEVEWMNKVHERITGYNTFSVLPPEEDYSLYHHKQIERQEKQNELYSTIVI